MISRSTRTHLQNRRDLGSIAILGFYRFSISICLG